MEKVKPITENLSTQEKIERALRIIENREEMLKELIRAARTNSAPGPKPIKPEK
jgi:hypothetical protein